LTIFAGVKEAREKEGFGLYCTLFLSCLFYFFSTSDVCTIGVGAIKLPSGQKAVTAVTPKSTPHCHAKFATRLLRIISPHSLLAGSGVDIPNRSMAAPGIFSVLT
jgi:hypothetical protein